jgi:purine nucleosidase
MPHQPARITIIDTDPGIDDAVAILLALGSPEFDSRGITTVAGNIGITTTTRNAGRILALAGRRDIP